MMDIRKLKELVRLMVDNDLTELDLRDKDEQATIRRQTTLSLPQVVHHGAPIAPAAQAPHSTAATPVAATAAAGARGSAAPAAAQDEAGLEAIESPMVGTFYAASGPDKPPLASVGMVVDANTVVCLLEAMKIFNEIKAERSGTIVKMMVQSGQAVEFGQPLFMIKPS